MIEHETDLLVIVSCLRNSYITVIDYQDSITAHKKFNIPSNYAFTDSTLFQFSTFQSFNGDLYCSSYGGTGLSILLKVSSYTSTNFVAVTDPTKTITPMT